MTCSVCNGSGWTKMYRHVGAWDWPTRWRTSGSGFICFYCNGTGIEPEQEVVRQPVYSHRLSADDTVTIGPPNATG